MSRLSSIAPAQATGRTAELFAALQKAAGKVPNAYATVGTHSPAALAAILGADGVLKGGSLSAADVEAIKLAVSELAGCDYCLAAHSILAGKRGYKPEEILNLRRGLAADVKFQAALQLAKAIAENKGEVNNDVKEAFFNAGYDEAALIDLIALVTIRTFTNYVYVNTKIPIDYPTVEKI